MSEEHIITVKRHARVYTHGTLSEKTEQIWLVAHGYGQLAAYFIRHFEVLDPETHFIIAPEALSRAYIDGLQGRVGASWMTSEFRQEEMTDYLNYLEQVVGELVGEVELSGRKLVAFGFSQGAATISRWANSTRFELSAMVLWGGVPAHELFLVECFKNLPLILAFGDKDEYLKDSKRKNLEEQLLSKGWTVKFLEFKGGHHLEQSLIKSISREL